LASSTSRSVANVLPQSMAPLEVLNLGEEEISDVTLATFKGTTRSRRLRRRLRRLRRTRRRLRRF
jgi:hypothetical protein